jgi:hypothetical protein
MSWNESQILSARRAIFAAAQDMLAGNLLYIEGSRKILALIETAKLDQWDADLVSFVGIDSETDALPVDHTRAYWQAAALEALQPEIDRMEAWARQVGESHCRNLVERFSSGEIEIKTLFPE